MHIKADSHQLGLYLAQANHDLLGVPQRIRQTRLIEHLSDKTLQTLQFAHKNTI
jgi:hypothetical protein